MTFLMTSVNFYRNIKGRYDLWVFLFKWDSEYRKDLITTLLAFVLFIYSFMTWQGFWDAIAMIIETGIIAIHLGTEMSILPKDYRPSHGGVSYQVKTSSHVSYDELSFPMSAVHPPQSEEDVGFHNPIIGFGISRDSPLSCNAVDDAVMRRDKIPYVEKTGDTLFIHSRHQIRYIACRVADKKQHTTNGVKLALWDLGDKLLRDEPVTVKKSYYYDALLTAEAFRSRIFRTNIDGNTEVFTDLTTYFPVKKELIGGADHLRFVPDLHEQVSGHIGITSLLFTENRRVAMLFQGSTKAIDANSVTVGGSGSMNYDDLKGTKNHDLKEAVRFAMAREVAEETGMKAQLGTLIANTRVTGFFRWINRCGKPEFVGITHTKDLDMMNQKRIDGDEVICFEEIPITVDKLEDFQQVMEWVKTQQVHFSLSSIMALRRMAVIGSYNQPGATPDQKKIYSDMSALLFGA